MFVVWLDVEINLLFYRWIIFLRIWKTDSYKKNIY